MVHSLSEFLSTLDAAGELHRVAGPVSPILEITEIADRHSKSVSPTASEWAREFDPDHCHLGGKALLFENVEGCDFPLAINVFGSYRRMEMALRCVDSGGFASIAARIASLVKPEPPASLRHAISKAREFLPLLRVPPRRGKRGVCQEVVRLADRGEVDLTRLPLMKCWPLDGDPLAVGSSIDAAAAGTSGGDGRYITFAGMHTIHADDADARRPSSHNIGMYRAQLLGPTQLAMHWHMHHDGAAHWRSWKRAGKPMPIAIGLGGEPIMPYAATAPLPPGLSELLMAGFLNGRGIPMVRAKTVPLWVPANCEIVIEGYVSTECGFIDYDPAGGEPLGPGAVFEGPFGDHTGFYSLPDRYPVVDVTAVTHRRNAVYPSTIVGLPPQEDYYLGKATERVFLPLLRTLIPDLTDYHLPLFGCFHNCAFIKIEKAYPLQGRRVMHSVWGAGQMAWTKMIVVVDDDVNVHDDNAVLEAIFRNCDFRRDLEIVNGPLDILDHAAPRLGAGHKIGFDATSKIVGEEVNGVPVSGYPRPGDRRADTEQRLRDGLDSGYAVSLPEVGRGRWVIVGVETRSDRDGDGTVNSSGVGAIEAVWRAIGPEGRNTDGLADLVIAVDSSVSTRNIESVLFHLCANGDPGRDMIRDGHRVGFDATAKMPGYERLGHPARPFPPILAMTDEIKARVDERAQEFGVGTPTLCVDVAPVDVP